MRLRSSLHELRGRKVVYMPIVLSVIYFFSYTAGRGYRQLLN